MKIKERIKRRMQVKRKGYFLAVVVFFIAFAALCMGFMLERSMRRLRVETELALKRSASDDSLIGMKYAEDWVISAVLLEGFPKARNNPAESDPMRRIEAVLSNGTSVNDAGSGINAELYVADADYEEGLFTGALKNMATSPFIPIMPSVYTDGETRRFYYLRSASQNGDGVITTREELLAVTLNKHTNEVSAERIFFRRVSNSN
jgi:hypothetical protein